MSTIGSRSGQMHSTCEKRALDTALQSFGVQRQQYFGGGGGGGGAFIGNHVHLALKVNCYMHVL